MGKHGYKNIPMLPDLERQFEVTRVRVMGHVGRHMTKAVALEYILAYANEWLDGAPGPSADEAVTLNLTTEPQIVDVDTVQPVRHITVRVGDPNVNEQDN